MLRVLVSLSPLMYRQAVALCVWRARPELAEVRIAPPETAEAQIASFRPHLLVHDEGHGSDAPILEDALAAVPCRVELLYSEGMHARVYAGGRSTEIRDASAEDLLGAVEVAASLAG